jgi:RNA polymerase sigma-70 factor (ECF subfamily)
VVSDADFRRLVAENIDFLWRCLRRFGVPTPHVDDAVQAVFLTASEKRASIEPGRERAFLVGVAMNVAAHARRSAARRGKNEILANGEDGSPEALDPQPSAEESVGSQQARQLLDQVLDTLDPDVRSVFVLFELEELTMTEIASLMGLPQGTVASRLRRGREAFQLAARRLRSQWETPKGGT